MSERVRQLSNTLVRIRYQNGENGRFAGCAVRLNRQFVVTCAHVLQTALGDGRQLKEGLIFSSFLPDYPVQERTPLLKLLAFHPAMDGDVGYEDIEDMALLEIQGSQPDTVLDVSCPEKYKEDGHDFFVKSSASADAAKATCGDISGAGWLNLKFVNSEQIVEPGDSGSPVWNETKQAITAMLVARKKQKAICYAIPMYKVMQAFGKHLVPQEAVSGELIAEDSAYLDQIRQDIILDLQQSDLFREQVRVWCELDASNAEAILSHFESQCGENGDFVGLIQSLRSAFDRAISALGTHDNRERKQVLDAARGIASKLVVFTIKQDAILRYKSSKNNKVRLLNKMAGSVAAGVAARTLGTRMKYQGHQQGRFDGDNYLALESGFTVEEKRGANNTVDLLLRKLGEKLVPHAKRDLGIESEKTDLVNRINAKIQRAKTDKDPKYQRKYFFILPLDCEEPSEVHRSVIQQLSEKIQDVTFFYITSKYAHDVLTVDDYAIDEVLIEFFTTVNEHSEK